MYGALGDLLTEHRGSKLACTTKADASVSSADTHNLEKILVHDHLYVARNNNPVSVLSKYLLEDGPPEGIRVIPQLSAIQKTNRKMKKS